MITVYINSIGTMRWLVEAVPTMLITASAASGSKRSTTAGPNPSGKRHLPPATPHRGDGDQRPQHHQLQQLSRRPFQPLHQPLSRLRARLHLLLRQTEPRLSRTLPGLDFETRLFAKLNAAELLRREFARPAYQPQTIVLGANTDPYQPIEHHYRLTRQLLEVMLAHRHPVGIITKSAMILRDLDLLTELASEGLCQVMVSVTTLNETLRRQLEPRASTGAYRLKVVEKLAGAGVPVGVLAAPMIRGSTSPSSSRSSKALPRPEPIAPTISCCDCPTSWHRCSVTGLMSTIPARRRRSSTSYGPAGTAPSTVPPSAAGCGERASLPICWPSAFG